MGSLSLESWASSAEVSTCDDASRLVPLPSPIELARRLRFGFKVGRWRIS